jgi:amino-acid N-acetyltransferase
LLWFVEEEIRARFLASLGMTRGLVAPITATFIFYGGPRVYVGSDRLSVPAYEFGLKKGSETLKIRKAELRDVPELFKLINRYVVEQVLLQRPVASLYEDVWEFTVAEEDEELLGCGALKFYNRELAEIRSLCVDAPFKSKGIGRMLTEALMDEAERYGLKTVFALTVVPGFFEKLGFLKAPRERFPVKVFQDCVGCPKYSCCDEIAVSYELAWRHTEDAAVPMEAIDALS